MTMQSNSLYMISKIQDTEVTYAGQLWELSRSSQDGTIKLFVV